MIALTDEQASALKNPAQRMSLQRFPRGEIPVLLRLVREPVASNSDRPCAACPFGDLSALGGSCGIPRMSWRSGISVPS